jgi:polyhydroxybutyrate depolymerase
MAMTVTAKALRWATLGLGTFGLGVLAWVANQRGFFQRAVPRLLVVRTSPSTILPALEDANAAQLSISHESIVVAGRPRTYLLVVPKPVPSQHKLALVFDAHGDGGDGPGFHRASPFERASGEAAVVVYPTGLRSTWDIETTDGNADHAFLEAIVDRVVRELPVDRARVFGTGYSSGAFLMNFMACAKPGFFRAIGSNAGSAPYQRAQTFPNGYTKCPGQKPVPMIALHGTRDFGVSLQSGRFSAEYWAYVNNCSLSRWETTGYPQCRAFTDCAGGNDVAYCEIDGLGHWVWERHAEATWSFFRAHGGDVTKPQ